MENEMGLSVRTSDNGGFQGVINVFKYEDDLAALFGFCLTGTR